MGREAAESLHHRPDAAATAAAAAILMERSGCARLFPPRRRSRGEAPRALMPPPSLPAPPALRLSPHTRRTPHTLAGAAGRPPFPLPSSLPALGPPPPRARPPRPARISVRGRKGSAPPAAAGGSRVSRRWRRLRAGRGYADSPAPGRLRAPGRLSESWVGSAAVSAAATLRPLAPRPLEGTRSECGCHSSPGACGRRKVSGFRRAPLSPPGSVRMEQPRARPHLSLCRALSRRSGRLACPPAGRHHTLTGLEMARQNAPMTSRFYSRGLLTICLPILHRKWWLRHFQHARPQSY